MEGASDSYFYHGTSWSFTVIPGDLVMMINEFDYSRRVHYNRVPFAWEPMIVLKVVPPYVEILRPSGEVTRDHMRYYKVLNAQKGRQIDQDEL